MIILWLTRICQLGWLAFLFNNSLILELFKTPVKKYRSVDKSVSLSQCCHRSLRFFLFCFLRVKCWIALFLIQCQHAKGFFLKRKNLVIEILLVWQVAILHEYIPGYLLLFFWSRNAVMICCPALIDFKGFWFNAFRRTPNPLKAPSQ